MKKRNICIFLAVFVTAFIFNSSMKNAAASSVTSGHLLSVVNRALSVINVSVSHNFIRKFAHFAEFFAQGFFLTLAAVFSRHGIFHHITDILFAGLLTACTDELLQTFQSGRSPQITDVFIDFGGTALSFVLILFVTVMIRRYRNVHLR